MSRVRKGPDCVVCGKEVLADPKELLICERCCKVYHAACGTTITEEVKVNNRVVGEDTANICNNCTGES